MNPCPAASCRSWLSSLVLRWLAVASLPAFAQPAALFWDTNVGATGGQGGTGTWSSSGSSGWWNGTANVGWNNAFNQDATFATPTGTVTVSGDVLVRNLTLPSSAGYVFTLSNASSHSLEVRGGISGQATARFSGNFSPTYNSSVLSMGLRFQTGNTVELPWRFEGSDQNAYPVLGADGAGTVVRYSGFWQGDQNNTYSYMAITSGAKIVLTEAAHLDMMLAGSYFTRQLWVYGDGTGTLELEPGFIGDRTLGGTVPAGNAAIRLRNTTLVTHTTSSLPMSFRPQSASGVAGGQANGHMVFENAEGSTWRFLSNPQEYPGAIWLFKGGTFDCQQDFTHTGVTVVGGDYTAYNAFQTLEASQTVTKTGPGTLTLRGEAGFWTNTRFVVQQGRLVMERDPTGTRVRGGTTAGQDLGLDVQGTASLSLLAPRTRLRELQMMATTSALITGRVEASGILTVGPTELRLGAARSGFLPSLASATQLAFFGNLKLTREDAYRPPAGTVLEIATGTIAVAPPQIEDATGLGLQIETLADRIRVTTTQTIPAHAFEAWQDDPAWGTTPAADRLPLATPQGDGVANIVKFALGWAPNATRRPLLPPFAVESDGLGNFYLTFRFHRPTGRTGAVLVAEAWTGTAWQTLPGGAIAISPNGDGTEQVVVRDIVPVSDAPGAVRWLRLGAYEVIP